MEVAIVAGVGPGTGTALARVFARAGYGVGLLSRHAESSDPVAAEIHAKGGKAIFVLTDVTNRQSVGDVVAKIRAQLGPVTAVAHNASGYGRAGFAPLAIDKSGLRMLGQSLAREFHPKGIHVIHVIVDGQIDTPRLRTREPNRATESVIPPDEIADAVIACLKQPRAAWSQEIDIRPAVENF